MVPRTHSFGPYVGGCAKNMPVGISGCTHLFAWGLVLGILPPQAHISVFNWESLAGCRGCA